MRRACDVTQVVKEWQMVHEVCKGTVFIGTG